MSVMHAASSSTTFLPRRRKQLAIGWFGSRRLTPRCGWWEFPISLFTSHQRTRTMVSRAPTAIAAARPSGRKSRSEHASKRSGSGMALEGSRRLPERQVHARRSIPTIGTLNVESASSLTGWMVVIMAKLHQDVEINSAGPASDGRWSVQSHDPTGPFGEECIPSRNPS